MSGPPLTRVLLTTLTVVLATFGLTAPAQAAAETGTVTGRLTDAAGKPLADWTVTAVPPPPWDNDTVRFIGRTGADGRYTLPDVRPGTYLVRFSSAAENRAQYAYGKVGSAEATRFTVTAGGTLAVDDALLPAATVTISAVDAATGAPVSNFCADLAGPQDAESCTAGSQLTLGNLAGGTYRGTVRPRRGSLHRPGDVTVTVAPGDAAQAVARLALGGAVRATVTDRATGAPVAGACVMPVAPRSGDLGDGTCTDESGVVRTPVLAPGVYQLFVTGPYDWDAQKQAYGHQWLGRTGGTGDRRAAARITVPAGTVATAPTVLLDRPGVVTGTVTARVDGAPVPGATVSFHAWDHRVGPHWSVTADAAGRYTIDTLGPYRWPLMVDAPGFPRQWSGGTGNRLRATTTPVAAGGTTTFDIALAPGVAGLTGTVTTAAGPASSGTVTAYNAVTGDRIGHAVIAADGRYDLVVPAGEAVKLGYEVPTGDGHITGWHDGAGSLDDAAVVGVRRTGTRTVDITVR